MLDRLDDLQTMMVSNGISAQMDSIDDEENVNNDRELIAEFLMYTKDAEEALNSMDNNNKQMGGYVSELITDKKSAQSQKEIQDEISALITEN